MIDAVEGTRWKSLRSARHALVVSCLLLLSQSGALAQTATGTVSGVRKPGSGAPTAGVAQANQQEYNNGVDFFFANTFIPTAATTYTRSFGSATSIGNQSGGAETVAHPIGVQQSGFQAWSGQAGSTPSISQPLGFSLMEFRRGGTFSQADGTVIALASWATSLPCNAPWFWIVTFTWGTTFTQTSSAAGATQNFTMSMRGEIKQSSGNQNYWTGSGDERNLNTGGISFIEDTIVSLAAQLVGAQEWNHSYFQVDGSSQTNRDPSAGAGGTFGFDPVSVGTGGTILRSNTSTINPGKPADAVAIAHEANHQLTGISNTVISLVTNRNQGGGLTADATGTFSLSGRVTNLVADPFLTWLALAPPFSFFLTTGGTFSPPTGDVGLSGSAQTIPLDLGSVNIPTSLLPLSINTQAIGIQLPSFSFITSADRYDIN